MAAYITPFTRMINLQDGTIPDAPLVQTRRLSDLKGLFADRAAEEQLLSENPLMYEVYEASENPEGIGQLRYSTTVLHPGKVGDEYFMTKGHYHALADRAEFYYGMMGEGAILMQTPEGEINVQQLIPGAMIYVPPYWGHRTINTGSGNLVLMAVYPSDAGYNYGAIADHGFASIIVERDGKPEIVPNPRYVKQV